ncbi:hypothetical protein MNBD_GAMMA21-1349 [hydrothermal vent metagenome]|uniref:TIGR04255 family protein n=1 Tax=hydrothermal vent metagenome TaxID=652676 RepID=A0A3B1A9B7_9ZZZZ
MTKKYPRLANPPIKEAILQFLVIPSDIYDSNLLKKFVEAENTRYPNSQAQRETLIQFMSGGDGQQTGFKDKGINGFKISSSDGLNIVQVFKDRLAISRLASYRSWGELLAETKRIWDVYKEIFSPKAVKGISVRYINHFLLPSDMKNFEDYLASTPSIPKDLPQGLASFYVNYKVPDPNIGAVASVQLLFEGVRFNNEPSEQKEPKIPIVLDTDIQMLFEEELKDEEMVWDTFSLLHNFKNKVFFKTVKEKTLEMFR